MKDTTEIRVKMLRLWDMVEQHKISAGEARLQISLARTILETLKVEIAAAHLNQVQIPAVPLGLPVKKLGLPVKRAA